jgi:hypothetical protein
LRCRGCGNEFNLTLRKHHCRGCGGIYCENCAPSGQSISGLSERARACRGCRLGETPGDKIRAVAKEMEIQQSQRDSSRGQIFSAEPIFLLDGSLYGEEEEASFKRADGRQAHPCGYFQITNKTDSICAIRVVVSGGDAFRECSRPSYRAILPHESLYAEFDPNVPGLDIMILHGNSHLTPRGGTIISDTRAPHVTPADIAPCARIENFLELTIHHIRCNCKNAILKYKGYGAMEIRQGTKAKITKGFVSMLMRPKGTTEDVSAMTMDFTRNVLPDEVTMMFSTLSPAAIAGGGGGGKLP